MFGPTDMKSDPLTVGLGRAMRAHRIFALHSLLYWYYHVINAPKIQIIYDTSVRTMYPKYRHKRTFLCRLAQEQAQW